jgi:hypothetical protein
MSKNALLKKFYAVLRVSESQETSQDSWCLWRSGPTPTHPELGCETLQRREYSGGSPTER